MKEPAGQVRVSTDLHPEELSTGQLFQELGQRVSVLVEKEVSLAKAELRSDLQTQLSSVKWMAAGGLAAVAGLNLLLVGAVLAASLVIAGWLAALILGSALILGGAGMGLWGWSRRVRAPLTATRESLLQDYLWAKETLH
jgi:hypothetical protein